MTMRNQKIEREAREWLARLYMEDCSTQTKALFEAWLAEDTRHAEAYKVLEEAWRSLADTDEAIIDQLVDVESVDRKKQSDFTFSGWLPISVAACLALFTVVFLVLERPTQFTHVTKLSQTEEITLPDKSRMLIGPQTSVAVKWSDSSRELNLNKGVAMFDVVSNSSAPFTVRTHNALVRVTGTRFEVKSLTEATRISVIEGHVRVQLEMGESYELAVQDELYVSTDGTVQARIATSEIGAWQFGQLSYEDVSLSEIIQDVNRYREKPLKLVNSDLGELRLTTSFDVNQTDQLLVGLTATQPVRITELKYAILLDKKK